MEITQIKLFYIVETLGMDTNLIWELFKTCGEIDSVRLVRDRRTGLNKGFGYVNFKSEDAVALAFKLDGTEVSNRPIRIHPCEEKQQKSRNRRGRKNKSSPLNKSEDNRPSKKFKNNSQQAVARSVSAFPFILFVLKIESTLSSMTTNIVLSLADWR